MESSHKRCVDRGLGVIKGLLVGNDNIYSHVVLHMDSRDAVNLLGEVEGWGRENRLEMPVIKFSVKLLWHRR